MSLRVIGGVALPILVFALGVSCERRPVSSQRDRTPVIALVNGRPLTERQFSYFLPEDYQKTMTSEEVKEYLDRWITSQLLYDEVVRSGFKIHEEMEFRLRQQRTELIADQFVQKVIRERAVVREDEARVYYDEHVREYTTEYRVSHVLVNTREDAEKVQSQLGDRSFEYLARRYSIDKHSRYGGDLGYLSKGNMIPQFEEIIFDMQVGDISGIVESEFGYHIIKIADIREARFKLGYQDVRNEIANMLTLEKREAVYDSLVMALWERADIEIMNEALRWAVENPMDTLSQAP